MKPNESPRIYFDLNILIPSLKLYSERQKNDYENWKRIRNSKDLEAIK